MKLTKDEIKQKLAEILEKQGTSISELEAVLRITKQAWGLSDIIPALTTAGKGGFYLGGGLSLLGGGVAGLAGYGAYKQLQDSEDRINAQLNEKKHYDDAIEVLNQYVASKQHPHVKK